MRLGNIAHLYLVRLKARVVLVQELFAVLGIAVGVALLFASQVASTSLDASVAQLANVVVGHSTYQLKARGPQGFDQSLVGEVARLPGVSAAVPVLERQANVAGPEGSAPVDLIATDPRYVRLNGTLLRHFPSARLAGKRLVALPGPIADRLGVGPLEPVRLRIGARVFPVLVGITLTARNVGALVHSPIMLAPLAYAQGLTGMRGRITRLLIRVEPGAQRAVQAQLLRLAPPGVNVEPANYDASLFSQAAGPVDQSTRTFAAICALVGFMFAYCAMLLTAELRRGLIRELRRGGATRWETVKTLLFDALVLTAVASLLGLALGDLLSIVAFSSPPGFLSFAFPIGSQRVVTWGSVLIAVGAGAAAACIGVLTPVLELRRSPGSAPRRAARESARWPLVMFAGGCLCLAITTAILIYAPGSAVIGVFALILALVLFLPMLLRAIVAGFSRLQETLGTGATALAAIELRSASTLTRSVAVAATAAIAVFGSVTIEGSRTSLQSGLDESFRSLTSEADLWVTPAGEQSLFTTVPFNAAAAPELGRLPGVGAAAIYRGGFLEFGDRRVWVLGPPATTPAPLPPAQILDGTSALANARLRAGGWAAISASLANQRHLRVGQSFVLPAPHAMRFRIAALTTNLGWPPGAVMINARDYAHAWEDPDPSAYGITLAPGASPVAVQGEIRRSLGPRSGLVVQTAAQREQAQQAASRQGLGRLTQIAVLVLVAGALAIATVMGAAIWQRRRRFARMKVQGYSGRTLWQALIWESALLIGSGCLLGAALGVYGQFLLVHALVSVTGFPVVLSLNLLIAITGFAAMTAVAAACIALPGYTAARVAPYPWPEV